MITVLTGGTGGAKFVDGLRQVLPAEELTIVVNTGDDMRWWGLHVSPDIDSIVYTLAGKISQERGWGVGGDTFFALKTMQQMGEPAWFSVGDRDLAMHVLRTKLQSDGNTLSEATAEIAQRLGIKARVLPMTDSRSRDASLDLVRRIELRRIFRPAPISRRSESDTLRRRISMRPPRPAYSAPSVHRNKFFSRRAIQ